MPANIDQMFALLQNVDNKQRAMLSSIRKSYIGTSKPPISTVPSPVVALKILVTGPIAITSTINSSVAMDLSTSRYRLKVIPVEKTRRMSENLCMYCGGAGHYAINCALIPKNKRVAINELAVTAPISKEKGEFSS